MDLPFVCLNAPLLSRWTTLAKAAITFIIFYGVTLRRLEKPSGIIQILAERENIFLAGAAASHSVLQEDRGQMPKREDAAQRDLCWGCRSLAVWSKKQRDSEVEFCPLLLKLLCFV